MHLQKSAAFQAERDNVKRAVDFRRELDYIIDREDAYLHQLMKIESTIVSISVNDSEIHDADVEIALQAIIDAAKTARNIPIETPLKLDARHVTLVEEIRLAMNPEEKSLSEAEEIEFLRCVWRVLISVRAHHVHDYPDNYLGFLEDSFGQMQGEDGEDDEGGEDDEEGGYGKDDIEDAEVVEDVEDAEKCPEKANSK
ncbi:MAG: hypothetical protein HQM09_16935 [Candidatus Riflebacteria bacterium]|nr:hypothetical protein [Candidatus Riflebacteria bacterium]